MTARALERGEIFGAETRRRLEEVQQAVRLRLAERLEPARIERLLEGLPPRYFLGFPPEEITRQLALAADLGGRTALAVVRPLPEIYAAEVVIVTRDHPRLFAELAGVFTSLNLNILAAQINTLAEGVALDVFQVTDPAAQAANGETALADPLRRERLDKTLEQVLGGQTAVDELVARRKRPSLVKARQVPAYPPLVEVDNAAAELYTVVDIFAEDRVGLLYDITRLFSELRLDIHLAKISTKGDQAADVFYLCRAGGGKIEDPAEVERLKAAVYAALAEAR